jgi:acylphosphatase
MKKSKMTMDEKTSHRHLIFHGRVQGVGFRETVRRKATRLGLKGTVKNLRDGTVEAYIAGPQLTIDTLLSELRGDFVIDAITSTEIPSHSYKDFVIL